MKKNILHQNTHLLKKMDKIFRYEDVRQARGHGGVLIIKWPWLAMLLDGRVTKKNFLWRRLAFNSKYQQN